MLQLHTFSFVVSIAPYLWRSNVQDGKAWRVFAYRRLIEFCDCKSRRCGDPWYAPGACASCASATNWPRCHDIGTCRIGRSLTIYFWFSISHHIFGCRWRFQTSCPSSFRVMGIFISCFKPNFAEMKGWRLESILLPNNWKLSSSRSLRLLFSTSTLKLLKISRVFETLKLITYTWYFQHIYQIPQKY